MSNLLKTNHRKKIPDTLKACLEKRLAEVDKRENVSYDERYAKKVDEAVRVISYIWQGEINDIESRAEHYDLTARNAFFISKKTLDIYSDRAWAVRDGEPKEHFFDKFCFKDEDDVAKFIKDVLACLPEGTTFVKEDLSGPFFEKNVKYTYYSFTTTV